MAMSWFDRRVAPIHLRRVSVAALRLAPQTGTVPLAHFPFVFWVFDIVRPPPTPADAASGPHCGLVQLCVDPVGIGLDRDSDAG